MCAVKSPRPNKKRPPIKTKIVNSNINIISKRPPSDGNDSNAQDDDTSLGTFVNPREDGCDDVPPAASANDDGGCVDNSDHLDALPETGVPDVIHPPVSREKDGSVCVLSDCSASNKPAATITEENPAKIGAMFDHCYTMMSVGSSLTSTPSHPVLINEELDLCICWS